MLGGPAAGHREERTELEAGPLLDRPALPQDQGQSLFQDKPAAGKPSHAAAAAAAPFLDVFSTYSAFATRWQKLSSLLVSVHSFEQLAAQRHVPGIAPVVGRLEQVRRLNKSGLSRPGASTQGNSTSRLG